MVRFALNHMTMRRADTLAVLDTAQALGFEGVELRNDLDAALFDGAQGAQIGRAATSRGVSILALAEIYGFNDGTDRCRAALQRLAKHAHACGAGAIVLIPTVAEQPVPRTDQRDMLRAALTALRPVIEAAKLTALIEPLGFVSSSLRFKEDAVAVLRDLGDPACFALIHDTFHHHIAGETAVFPGHTRVVHISGVTDPRIAPRDMTDAHRGLVDARDRLGTIDQITALRDAGYAGPFSFEAFAPDVHSLEDPARALATSAAFITAQVA